MVAGSGLLVGLYITRKSCHLSAAARREFDIASQDFMDTIGLFEVDADAEKALISRLDVKGLPILLIFDSGIERLALLGFYSADELRKRIWSIISTGGDG